MKQIFKNIVKKTMISVLVFAMSFSAAGITTLAASGDTTVYVTKTGKCYHADGCSSLSKSKISISLEKAVVSYKACSKCNPPTLDEASQNTKDSVAKADNSQKTAKTSAKNAVKSAPANADQNTEKMVWLSATGSKYHSKNNCGKMNPSKARQVSESDAVAAGMDACSKCW